MEEENAFFRRWDHMLGLVWEEEQLEALAEGMRKEEQTVGDLEERDAQSSAGPLRFALSLLIRPELIETLRNKAIPPTGKAGMPHVPHDSLSLSDVQKEEFIRKMGGTILNESRLEDADPFAQSSRPQAGFPDGTFGRGK